MNGARILITRSLKAAYIFSLGVGLLLAGVSLAGLLYQARIYPTEELRNSFVANDVVNLFIGLPILLGSMWLTRSGRLVGLLLWPGALLYAVYNYIAYLFGVPLGGLTFGYLVIVLLSVYLIYYLLHSVDMNAVRERLEGAVPVRSAGWIMLLFGAAFLFRAIGMIAQAITGAIPLPLPETGVLIADLVVSVLWIIGGALLLKRTSLGYVSGLGLLFAASMLFVALIMFFLIQPVLTDAPLALVDILVILGMGIICSLPLVQFVRGVLSKDN